MYFQWLTLCLVSWHFLDSYYVFAGIFSFGTTDSPQNTYRAIYTLSDNKNTWQIDNCNIQTIAGPLSMFPCRFRPDCGFYRHFYHLVEKNLLKTQIGLYVVFLTTKPPGRWIIFMIQQKRVRTLFFDSFWTVIMVSTNFSLLWRENGTKYSHKVRYSYFWCTSNDWLHTVFIISIWAWHENPWTVICNVWANHVHT